MHSSFMSAAKLVVPALVISILVGSMALRAEGEGITNSALWTDPAPGEYNIMPASGMCAERVSGGSIFVAPHLAVGACDPNLFGQSLEVSPVGREGNATSGATNITWRITNGNECATVARGVVFGAPRVDMLGCDNNGPDRNSAGVADQRFTLRPAGTGRVSVVTQDGRCWTAEGPRISGKYFIEPCDGRAGQIFTLERSGGLMTEINRGSASNFGWTNVRTNSVFDRQFRLPQRNLPSGDYAGIATANDQGVQCAILCADDVNCKAYTWVDPRNRGGTPMCYKKNRINAPVADAMTQSGIIRP
jgi:hypothetical protein